MNAQDKTREIIRSMMQEEIGKSMLDSGGFYGYSYEYNRKIDLDDQPHSHIEVTSWGLNWQHSLYHWLNEKLTYDEPMDRLFQFYCNMPENKQDSWYETMHNFTDDFLADLVDDFEVYDTENTYNYDNLLDGIVQFRSFKIDDTCYVLLQYYGGCDVRGGYTMPRVFTVEDEYGLSGASDGTLYCKECECGWNTDDGYNLYFDSWKYDAPLVDRKWNYEPVDPESTLGKFLVAMWRLDGSIDLEQIERVYGDKNFVFQSPDGVVCPHCGKGVLSAWFS